MAYGIWHTILWRQRLRANTTVPPTFPESALEVSMAIAYCTCKTATAVEVFHDEPCLDEASNRFNLVMTEQLVWWSLLLTYGKCRASGSRYNNTVTVPTMIVPIKPWFLSFVLLHDYYYDDDYYFYYSYLYYSTSRQVEVGVRTALALMLRDIQAFWPMCPEKMSLGFRVESYYHWTTRDASPLPIRRPHRP